MKLINGDLAIDDRGKVSFVNDFDFKGVKRFYMVENHATGFIRAWHGHWKEAKYVLVVSGAAIVATVPMEGGWDLTQHVLSADKPQVLYIPPGFYNGFKTLTPDTKVMFFSTSTLKETKGDDKRLPADMWEGVFEVEER